MSVPTDPRAWDHTWDPQLESAVPDLDGPTLENHVDATKLAFLGADLPRAGRAVEVGCGSARLLARVARAAPLELVGVDASPSALRLVLRTTAATGTRIRPVLGDARALPVRSGSCALVLSGGLLEHFPDPRPVLAEMVRILAPGGVLYADVVPRRFSLFRLRELPRMIRSAELMPGVHESTRGPGGYRRLLEELGCAGIRIRSAGVYPPFGTLGWARRTRALDGMPIAGLLGWYFMIVARRAG
jgi:SAM-dependent methyltransferase